MNKDPVISLESVSKSYRIWSSPSARLTSSIWQFVGGLSRSESRLARRCSAKAEAAYHDFQALSELSLEVRRGECLGIIGRNGAGKSTLLQIIAGTLQPSTGEIDVRGRVAALLELGSGFNPDFTGRENVYLNATILGLTKAEIERKFAAIVEYSGISEFIDQPVRTYSSGMALRLAFSVCVHVDADILIIDEALAVGDARFSFKCAATLDQMIAEGRTIIFVSHDTNSVKRLCDRAVLLERGEAVYEGVPNDVVNLYTKLITSPHGLESIRRDIALLKTGSEAAEEARAEPDETAAMPSFNEGLERLVAEERAHQQISDKEYAYGGEDGVIEKVSVHDEHGAPRLSFVSGSRIQVRLVCKASAKVDDPIYAITFKDIRGQEIFGTNTFFQNLPQPSVLPGKQAEVLFDVQLNVLPGVYFISCGWVRIINGEVQVVHRRYDVIRFDILPRDKSFGIAYCPTRIAVHAIA